MNTHYNHHLSAFSNSPDTISTYLLCRSSFDMLVKVDAQASKLQTNGLSPDKQRNEERENQLTWKKCSGRQFISRNKAAYTRVTAKVNFKATGLVIAFLTAWVGTGELARLSEMGPVVGEQGTEGDEGLLTSCGVEHIICIIFLQCYC